MNKGSQKSTAINHIDKTLDDYIKKAKTQTKGQPGQPKSGKVTSPTLMSARETFSNQTKYKHYT